MGDEYEELKKCFDIEKLKNNNLINEINNLKEKLSDDNFNLKENQLGNF